MEQRGGAAALAVGGGPAAGPEVAAGGWGLSLVALIVGAFMALLDASIVNVAIPTLERVFGVGTIGVEWVVTVYLLALGVVVPTSGWLGDRLGFKRLYVYSLLTFVVGSGLCALAPGLPLLVAARVIQAVGGGMIMPTTMSMVYRIVPRRQIGVASGWYGMAMLLAPAIGPALGGYLVEYWNWRWIFTINLPIGAVGALFAATALPEFAGRDAGPFDLAGGTAASVGLFALLLALSEGGTWGWRSETITWLFFAAGVALIAFVWIELTVPRPLLDLTVFRYLPFTGASVFVLGASVALSAPLFFIPLFLQLVDGKGALTTGLILMPGALASGLLMPVGGRLYDRLGPLPPVLAGVAILGGATWLFHGLSLTTPDATIAAWMAFRGIGMGLAMMPATTAGMTAVPTELVGRASALNNIVQRVAASFGIAALTVLLDNGIAAQQSALAAALQPGSAAGAALARALSSASANPAAGLAAVGRMAAYVQQLAFVRSLDDLFVLLAVIGLLTAVPALMLGSGRRLGGRGGMAPAPPAE